MTSNYFKELDEASKARYLQKLTFDGTSLPDPLDEAIRPYTFLQDVKLWPLVHFGDVYNYLVHGECVYTNETFNNFKALDSYNYFNSGKVKNILTYKIKNLDICIVTCDVQASQTLKIHHRPWIVTATNGRVHSGHCTCMAGLGEVCSHVSALLFALDHATREGPPSSTSLPCTWNKCAKTVPPLAVVDINFQHNRKNKIRCKRPREEFKMPPASSFKKFLEVIKENVPKAPVLKMLSDEDTSTASESEMQEELREEEQREEEQREEEQRDEVQREEELRFPEESIKSLIQHYKKLSNNLPGHINLTDASDFFIENSVFSPADISKIEKLTRGQHKSPLWLQCRQGRITASLFGRILKCTARGRKNLIATIMQQKSYSNSAMIYGQKTEELAKNKLKELLEDQHVNAEVLPTGLLIDRQYGFLGASPDGMVICDCCDSALLEIKCPQKGIGLSVKDIEKKNFYLDTNLNLKQNYNYYDQIQGQMGIWGLSKCYFVTYTDVDLNVEIINYDSQYWSQRRSHLVAFFKQHILPEIFKNF